MRRLISIGILASSSLLAQSGDYQGLVKEYEAAQVDAEEFLNRFQQGAKQRAGTDAAVPYLLWILENGGPHRAATTVALDTLMDEHIGSSSMDAVADRLPYLYPILGEESVGAYLDRLVENGDREVQAHALFSRASMAQTKWGIGATDEGREAAKADLDRVVKLTKNSSLENRAKAMKFDARDLQVGDVAPEIFGMDIDGVPFKLSDYRGKVVVLDFWGDW